MDVVTVLDVVGVKAGIVVIVAVVVGETIVGGKAGIVVDVVGLAIDWVVWAVVVVVRVKTDIVVVVW